MKKEVNLKGEENLEYNEIKTSLSQTFFEKYEKKKTPKQKRKTNGFSYLSKPSSPQGILSVCKGCLQRIGQNEERIIYIYWNYSKQGRAREELKYHSKLECLEKLKESGKVEFCSKKWTGEKMRKLATQLSLQLK